ncbi:MAG: DUF3800 domain-containing protein [Rhodovibrionaceae bacterium]
MPDVMHFYMDDSGTRHPDHKPGRVPRHGHDWFGLGGVLIKQEDEDAARAAYDELCSCWKISAPLRSADIRSKAGPFAWLGKLETAELERFYEELYQLLATIPVTGHGCVIDRPGYNARYREKYGRERWSLCKTAFSVSVERAAKLARGQGYKLKVFVERGDPKADKHAKQYYDSLRKTGTPFDPKTSGKYAPLTAAELADTLYEFRTKFKSSPLMQIADLYLWPICIGGYDQANRTYARLKKDGKLIDCLLDAEQIPAGGIKYSCWELVGLK